MSARTGLLVGLLWLVSILWTYQFASQNVENAHKAAVVPAIVKAVQKHEEKADKGHQVAATAAAKVAKVDQTFQKIEEGVLTYAQQNPGRADCSLNADGLRLWRAANRGEFAEPEGSAGRGSPGGVSEGAAGSEGRGASVAVGQPRGLSQDLPQVPDQQLRPDQVGTGGAAVTDIVDQAILTEEENRQAALQRIARHDGSQGKTVRDSAEQCSVCDDPIPQLRREAVPGVHTCVACQDELEREMRAHTRGY